MLIAHCIQDVLRAAVCSHRVQLRVQQLALLAQLGTTVPLQQPHQFSVELAPTRQAVFTQPAAYVYPLLRIRHTA
ncbi:hypothetical protein EON66_07410 [archaeon]|nr:MAG: hypothetical protein EON66_07410 [archaeon]